MMLKGLRVKTIAVRGTRSICNLFENSKVVILHRVNGMEIAAPEIKMSVKFPCIEKLGKIVQRIGDRRDVEKKKAAAVQVFVDLFKD
jgi:hypothetical protein